MSLSIVRDGNRFPYSEKQLRIDNPSVSFPKDLRGVDLSAYGVIVDSTKRDVGSTAKPAHQRLAMHLFLYGLRQFGMRVQFERYMLAQKGHARDFWMSAPFVARSSTYVQHMAQFFGLSEKDLDAIYAAGSGVEE